MYVPPAFQEGSLDRLHDLIRHYPLGTLVTAEDGLLANHVPFTLIEGQGAAGLGVLRAHLARANGQVRIGSGSIPALAIFLGVEHYVSPAWYPTKRLTGKVVPTWNYVAVHASGSMRIVDDPVWVRAQIETLTARHEGGREKPWAVSDAPDDFIAAQLKGIVGIEIDVTDLQGKWKLSQNRTANDREGVARGLEREGTPEALAMAPLIPTGKAV